MTIKVDLSSFRQINLCHHLKMASAMSSKIFCSEAEENTPSLYSVLYFKCSGEAASLVIVFFLT